MTERSIEFPEKDLPLRDDVGVLGAMVGEMLQEQVGEEFYQLVESVRRAAIARREDEVPAQTRLSPLVTGLETELAGDLVHAFSTYFQVVNLAEKVHRIRRLRDYLRDGVTIQGSLRDVLQRLRDQGISRDTVRDEVERLVIEPVMTAHPTEATRRTLLEKERQMLLRLVERLDPTRTPHQEEMSLDRVRQAVTTSWQTEVAPHIRPTVADEREHVLYYLTDIVYSVVPAFYETFRAALDEIYPEAFGDERLPSVLHFGSWVGGDMDGNPNVNASTIAETLTEHRELILARYRKEVRLLMRELSQSTAEVTVNDAVLHRIERYKRLLPETSAQIRPRHQNMPYRSLLQLMAARLDLTDSGGDGGYASATELLSDLQLIRASLEQNRGVNAGLFPVRRLMWRVRTFGFHLASLDIREDALILREAVGDLIDDPDWVSRGPAERTVRLAELLESDEIEVPQELSHSLDQVLRVMEAIGRAGDAFGSNAIGTMIVSMTRNSDDVLSAMLLAKAAGLTDDKGALSLDLAPLLETVDDLQAGEGILRGLADTPAYRRHLETRGNRQLVMIGYSDSNKDGGIASARWALQEAQTGLTQTAQELGIRLGFFHGRGGTVSRGGGNTVEGILAAPAGSVDGYLRVTEQGEVIHQKYGVRAVGLRNLEQMTGAVLNASLRKPAPELERWGEAMAKVADRSREAYRALVFEDDRFVPYFRQATPIDVIERLAIGSRPAARRSKMGIENLRAIPWVFSWAQTRVGLPGSYGLGVGLQAAAEEFGMEFLRDMLGWPFFHNLVNDVEMVLAKSDLEIGRRYSQLADESVRGVFDEICRELRSVGDLILEIKQADALLAEEPMLRRSIRLRNPYIDPMNLMQIDLLQRWRETKCKDDELMMALFATVNGISRGIQNTG
ncbi:MAG: phosphoenolpyruvate carboxylase [Xanthomonadales bacterium]|nr:phosphoenolpyruvate carboxylase [Xanthomonadales bacterium]